MGDPKKHHFVPQFLLKHWTYDDTHLWLYLKNDIEKGPISASVASVGYEKNLYTSRNGDKSVEIEYFSRIDGAASAVLKNITENEKRKLIDEEKIALVHFVSTFQSRSPSFLNSMKDFNELMRKRGEIIAEKNFKETGVDYRNIYKKEQYDDFSKIMQMHSTIGEKTAMSKHYENDFNKLMASEWIIYENNSNADFITSDFPLRVIQLSNEKSLGIEIPKLFAMLLPLSPVICLVISNCNGYINWINMINQNIFVHNTNVTTINNAKIQIYARQDKLKYFIKKHLINPHEK